MAMSPDKPPVRRIRLLSNKERARIFYNGRLRNDRDRATRGTRPDLMKAGHVLAMKRSIPNHSLIIISSKKARLLM